MNTLKKILITIISFTLAISNCDIGDCENGWGKYIYNNHEFNDYYEGYWKNAKPHGDGKMIYISGNTYEGNFENGSREGMAIFTWKSGGVWEGIFKDNTRNGPGVYTTSSGSKYEGSWIDDSLTGIATYTDSDGGQFIGNYLNGVRNGEGTYNYSNGNIYEGNFKDDIRVGFGKFTWVSGTTYIGMWDDVRNGFGILDWAGDYEGKIYIGEFKDDEEHGYGGLVYPDESEEVGIWSDGEFYKSLPDDEVTEYLENKYIDIINKITSTTPPPKEEVVTGCTFGNCDNGTGLFVYTSGNVYDGEFKNSRKNGFGTFKWLEGDIYTGEWKDDIFQGYGEYSFSNGNIYEGEFYGGVRNGIGLFTFNNGDLYEGQWKDDKRDGFGVYEWKDETMYMGEFKNGNFDGYGVKLKNDDTADVGIWKDDKFIKTLTDEEVEKYLEDKHPEMIEYLFGDENSNNDESNNNNGCISGNCNDGWGKYIFTGEFDGDIYEGNFKDGYFNGHGKYTWKYGDIFEGNYKNGLRNGKGNFKFINGDYFEGSYIDNYASGKGYYKFANGDVFEGIYKDGKENGLGSYEWINGDFFEGNWINSERTGLGIYIWGEDWKGQVYFGEWKNGEYNGYGAMVLTDESLESGIWNNGDLYKEIDIEDVGTHITDKYGDLTNYYIEKYFNEDELSETENICTQGNCQNGWGTLTIGNDTYSGSFKNSSFDGYGTYNWGKGKWEGEQFTGTWKDGEYIDGKYIWPNGDVYIGQWKNAVKHGNGKYMLSDGSVYEGEWKDGVLVKDNNPFQYTITNNEIFQNNQNENFNTGEYHALIICANDYKYDKEYYFNNKDKQNGYWADLDHPINDGNRLKNILTSKYQFEYNNVVTLNNPTRSNIIENLEYFKDKLNESDNFLLFYAGHGHWLEEDRRRGYWIPVDGQVNSRANWLSDGTVKDLVAGMKPNNVLVIADACFSGAIFQSRSINQNQAQSIEESYFKKSRIVLTSGNLETVPDRSIFLDHILRTLETNNDKYFSSRSIYENIFVPVNNSTDNEPQWGQMPNTGDENGDFIFIRK